MKSYAGYPVFAVAGKLPHAHRFLVLISLFLIQGCYQAPKPCQNLTTSEDVSPNGQLKAVAFRRVCPEEHSITTHVSIVRVGETLPDGNGNVFAYDNEIAVRAVWLNNNRLAIYTYADPLKGTRLNQVGNVSVEYSKVVETYLVTPIPSPNEPALTPADTPSANR